MAGDEFFSNHFSNTSESAAISANEVRLFGAVHSVSSQLGRPVYLVGGYVRDMLLGRPNNDIDFVTLGSTLRGWRLSLLVHVESRIGAILANP